MAFTDKEMSNQGGELYKSHIATAHLVFWHNSNKKWKSLQAQE